MDYLTLTPQNNILNGLVLYETVDRIALGKLIHSSLAAEDGTDWWLSHKYKTEKQQLTKYYESISNGQVKVEYCRNYGSVWGRCNPKKSLSLFTIRREVRHTISANYYTDIDIYCCHHVILHQICKPHGVPCDTLENYINNRDYHLETVQEMYSVDEDAAKNLFISLMNGGGFSKWADKNKVSTKPSEFIQSFINELYEISIFITTKNPEI